MAIDKLIPQYLNSDTDQKLVKSVEMTDNLNIRVSNDDEGTAGVVKNIKGTDVVSNRTAADAFPSGDNVVIGSVANEKNKEIIFILWNSNDDHGIYKLDMVSGKYQKLYEDSVLNLQKSSYVDCDVIVNEENESLFYWTDNVNPPMKVNVNRLISGGYPSSLTSGTDEEKLLCLTVSKQRPLSPPSYTLVNNSSLDRNAIREKHFQFAYRYKYADGEVSALSDWSSHTFASTQIKSDFLQVSSKDFYNQINVFVKNTVADAEKITVYAKELNSQTFYEIEELSNNFTSNSSTINFTNNKIGSALSLDEVSKSYDNVPQVAKAQAITGNRLMYGNYTEGYENYLPELDSNVIYREKEATYTIKAYVEDNGLDFYQRQSSVVGISDYEIKLDYSSLPSTVPANSFINIEFVLVAEKLKVYADANIKHTAFTFDFTTNADILSNKINDSIVFTTGTRQTPRQSSIIIPLKNTVFKENFRSGAVKSKSQIIAEINNRLSTNTFTGIVDSDRNQETDGLVYAQETVLFGLVSGAKAKIHLEGTASFKLQQAALVNDIKTFYLRFAGASLSVKQAEIIDYDYIPTAITSYPVAVEITNAPVHKIGGESGFNINTLFTVTTEAEYDNSGISGTSSYIATSLEGYSSFKSDSQHSFGIVYTDDRGRTSGVNKIDPVFVKAFSDRDAKGGSLVDFRIKSQAPSWAKKWQMVYGGNSSVDKFLQYTVASPLIPKDKDEFVSENLYISFNTLEGSNNSYKEKTGANLEYKYQEGDILKIIRYENSFGYLVYPEDHEFRVIGYEKLEEDADRFLAPAGRDFQTKFGWALKLEDVDKAGFSFNTVKQGNGLWENNVVVEIYSPKKELEEKVYYGVGKTYDVVSKQHYGDRTIASNASGTLTIDGAGGATSSDRFYIGDQITVSGTVITIVSVTVETDGTFSYQYRGVVSAQAAASYLVNNYSDANVTISRGDVFFRARRLVTRDSTMTSSTLLSLNWDESSFSTIVDFIEDYSISDFYRSSGFVANKPYAFIPDSKTIRRRSSITYSDAYVIDSDRLNLSSFNLSLANWTDLDLMHGSINSLVPRGDALTVIQESKASQLPIGKNIIEFSSGNANVTASKNVLGGASYYAGDYGTSNPESVVERFGVVYFVDAEAGKVIRLSSDGITPISEKGVDSFFENKFKSLISTTQKPKIVGGFDPDNNEYIITVPSIFRSSIIIGTSPPTAYFVPTNSSGVFAVNNITYTPNTFLWNTFGANWGAICDNWENIGNGIIFVDDIYQNNSVLVDDELLGSTATINIILTDSTYSFIAVAQLNLSTGVVTVPSTTCNGTTSLSIGNTNAAGTGFTIAYKHKEGVWGSKYSFKPTMYVNINNELYSFSDESAGLVWKHNVNATRNNFYGTQYTSEIEVVSNRNPSMIKVFEALAVEGGGTWVGSLTTSDQSTTIGTSDFDVREGHRYAMIPRDTLVSKGHQIYIGKVESISSDKVTFTTPVNRLPFVVGDILKTASGSSLSGTGMEISGVSDRKTIQCTTSISNISVGDNVFVEHSARIDGDPMRDVFLKIKLFSSDTTAFEVHALSLSYDRSRLHNDRVN